MKIVIWYLLLNNAHGLVVVPQESKEQCYANVRMVNNSHSVGFSGTYADCIQGVGQIPEH